MAYRTPLAPPNERDRARVIATLDFTAASDDFAEGFSGQESATRVALVARENAFANLLRALPTPAGRDIFACAEPNAMANMILRGGSHLAQIRISFTTYSGGFQILRPCANCEQWLEETTNGSRVYKIKSAFLPQAATQTFTNNRSDFPALGSHQK